MGADCGWKLSGHNAEMTSRRGPVLLRLVGHLPIALCHLRVRAGVRQRLTRARGRGNGQRPFEGAGSPGIQSWPQAAGAHTSRRWEVGKVSVASNGRDWEFTLSAKSDSCPQPGRHRRPSVSKAPVSRRSRHTSVRSENALRHEFHVQFPGNDLILGFRHHSNSGRIPATSRSQRS